MPANISPNSFATAVRKLVWDPAHFHGITDIAVVSILGKGIGPVRKAAENDQLLKNSGHYITIVTDEFGNQTYYRNDGRAEFVYKPKTARAHKPAAKRSGKKQVSSQFPSETVKQAIAHGVVPLVLNTIPPLAIGGGSQNTPLALDPVNPSPEALEHFAAAYASRLQEAADRARVETSAQRLHDAVWTRFNEMMAESLSAAA